MLQPAPTGLGWQSGLVELRPVYDQAESSWILRLLNELSGDDVQVAQPARATDGRQIVGGWMAYRFPAEDDAPTVQRPGFDDLMLTSVKLHQALAHVPRPEFLDQRDDVYAHADRLAWGDEEATLDESGGGRWFEILAGSLRPVSVPDQVVHGDLYREVRITAGARPVVVGFRPYFRPAEWASALVVVDAIAFGGADASLAAGWSHLAEWPQMLLRAMLFRLACHALDQEADPGDLDGLREAAGIVSGFA